MSEAFRVVVAGGRTFDHSNPVYRRVGYRWLDRLLEKYPNLELISGRARGADQLGEHWSERRNVFVHPVPAEWDRYGKSAGYRRNAVMADMADGVLAFWDGQSRGTKHMINLAEDRNLPLTIVTYQ